MKYKSISNTIKGVSFQDALFANLASDDSLFVPESIPALSRDEIVNLHDLSLGDLGTTVMSYFIDDIPQSILKEILFESLNFPISLRFIDSFLLAELFHGPTLSFKDIAARVMSRLMSHYLSPHGHKVHILVATSGDTGGAIAHAFSSIQNVNVIVLFPKGRVSDMQFQQLTNTGENVHSLEVDGSFDDCQSLVKHAFKDSRLRNLSLMSANSINIGRLLPQVIYHAYVSLHKPASFSTHVIPSGNLGNATACLIAKLMGFPIGTIVLAVNSNNTMEKYMSTGIYRPKKSKKTFSTAMDVGNPNNFPRYFHLSEQNFMKFKDSTKVVSVSDSQCIATIKDVHKKYDYILDPHTSVAWTAAKMSHIKNPVIYATASPKKFVREISDQCGINIKNYNKINNSKTRYQSIGNNYDFFPKLLLELI